MQLLFTCLRQKNFIKTDFLARFLLQKHIVFLVEKTTLVGSPLEHFFLRIFENSDVVFEIDESDIAGGEVGLPGVTLAI